MHRGPEVVGLEAEQQLEDPLVGAGAGCSCPAPGCGGTRW
ncbi:hypothetical protein STAFG_1658 [Streptomyces afghaniensis 772]|uniref:Uncharacterized protein n=1 Tax=Streptomyces afghaniensis 772 TaxID=1283301 RepID=S4N2G4_9ACTN|nr:hypothetical protein STAFG_1658 [Streptomyces afghaniensis 772]